MGAIGGGLRAFQGDPDFRTLSNVKNRNIQSKIKGLLGDWDTSSKAGKETLDTFAAKYKASQPAREAQSRQESGVIDRYYNGGMETILSNLRKRKSDALRAVTDRALDYATRTRKATALGGGGGSGSSYLNRMALLTGSDIERDAALQEADQERADIAALEANRLGLLGQRGAVEDAAFKRELDPKSMSDAELSRRIGMLGNITQLDQLNNFYGVQKKSTGLDRWANFMDAADQGIMNGAATAGNIYGMAGGGGGGGGTGGGM